MKSNLLTAQKHPVCTNDCSDYTLHFGPIQNSKGSLRFVDHSREKEQTINFMVDDKEFGYRVPANFPSIIADLIDLAVAIYASDRLAAQDLNQKQRRLNVVLPVRNPESLRTKSFSDKLETLLEWATGSRWSFDFQLRITQERLVEQQSLPIAPQGREVILWSGGLDAFAGLYTQLRAVPEKRFVLFGTGSNDNIYHRQGEVAKKVQSIFPGRCDLYRLPLRFSNSGKQDKNKISRARGVVFTMLGSACAYLMGQRLLNVYENGIGAINLPYRASAVGLDHSRSVHPLTLLMVSNVISDLLGEKFHVHNPFLFSTKAQMCKSLEEDGRSDLPPLTRSCDSPHRQKPGQCGYCSSCILRRQALAASKIEDLTPYVLTHGKQPAGDPSLHLRHMLSQINMLRRLLSDSDSPNHQWEALTEQFPSLDDIVDRSALVENLLPTEIQRRLILLYRTYVTEWDAVEPQIATGLINRCTQGTSEDT